MKGEEEQILAAQVDRTAIGLFVETVFSGLDGHVAIRAISEKGTPDKKPWPAFHTTTDLTDALGSMAPEAARQQRGLFVVPATVAKPGSARAEDILETSTLIIDLDDGNIGEARDHLVDSLGTPTLEVASGGETETGQAKLHLYWCLSDPARGDDLDRLSELRGFVATKVGADPSFKRLTQPVRVPGSVHGKYGIARPVRILSAKGPSYTLDDLKVAAAEMVALVSEQTPTRKRTATKNPIAASELMTMRVRENGVDGITRFDAVSKVIGHWVRQIRLDNCTQEDAWIAVCDYNAACIEPPYDEVRLAKEFQSLRALDAKGHGSGWTATNQVFSATASPPSNSEDALADLFVKLFGQKVRYVRGWRTWYVWNNTHWAPDETGSVQEFARQVCRNQASKVEPGQKANRMASRRTIEAVVRIATTDPRIAARTSDWDQHASLINTPGGVVDLSTGEILDHDPDLMMTQMTAAEPGTGCPRWAAFLKEITNGDVEVQSYLQRLAGYCLTGFTNEQMFAFLHGSGANGKSVFLNTIAEVLGDYAATATIDTFMASRSDRHLTELAGLCAARLVIVPETEAGRKWAEARIKTATGGELIRANFMRQDHFEFKPQFKLIVAGNHRPQFSGVGEAMRRRLHLVPFNVTIPEEKRDRTLQEQLKAERDGILGWMLDGCAEWHSNGLAPPETILKAAGSYFQDEDIVGQWIEEYCAKGSAKSAPAKALFQSWSAWAEESGFNVGSQKSLGEALRERGFENCKVHGHRGWRGLAPNHPTPLLSGGAK